MKKSIIALFVISIFILSTTGFAQAPGRMAQASGHQWMKKAWVKKGMNRKADFLKKLKLTDQQKEKIANLKIDFQKKMVDLKADLQKDKLDLKELRIKGNFNRNDVIAAVEKINKSRDAMTVAMANHMLDIYEVLTPDQQKIAQKHFFNRMNERRDRCGMMMRMRGGMHGGRAMMMNK